MTPADYHLQAVQNVEMVRTFYWKTGPVAGPNTPIDLTGFTARHLVVNAAGVTVVNLATGGAGMALTALTGKIESTFSRAAMNIAAGEYRHILVLTSATLHDYPLLAGRFSVAKGVPV